MKVTTDTCLFGAWVAAKISDRQQANGNRRLLDVGAGTGLLSLIVAQKCEGRIDAIEIDRNCAEQAIENIAASPFNEKIKVVQADVLQWQPAAKYDCIFSNPPFYEKEIASLLAAKNVAHHGEGLKLAELLQFIKTHLVDNGHFFLLLPAKREKELNALLKKAGIFIQQKALVQQTPKHPAFRLMIHGRCEKVNQERDEIISIKNENNDYTPAFISLLKDYYLYF